MVGPVGFAPLAVGAVGLDAVGVVGLVAVGLFAVGAAGRDGAAAGLDGAAAGLDGAAAGLDGAGFGGGAAGLFLLFSAWANHPSEHNMMSSSAAKRTQCPC